METRDEVEDIASRRVNHVDNQFFPDLACDGSSC